MSYPWFPEESAVSGSPPLVLTLFGTRPEVVKLAPVLEALETLPGLRTLNIFTGQHADLARPFLSHFGVRVDGDLGVMQPGQGLTGLCAAVMRAVDEVVARTGPALVLVQGDTTSAMAGTLAGFHRGVPVGHVEAGLRSGDLRSPFPEEANRRVVSALATYHFAPTETNRAALLREGVPAARIHVTGNPVVDALLRTLEQSTPSPVARALLADTEGMRRVVLTTHRRESFGRTMRDNLAVLGEFVTAHPDVALIFPVHPNPEVEAAVAEILTAAPRVYRVPPLEYPDFVHLLANAWLIVSDSGGVQEEAPTLGKPLLVLREHTERGEALHAGVARLVGTDPARLAAMLEEVYGDDSWVEQLASIENPFGRGDAGRRIAHIVGEILGVRETAEAATEATP
jgi:UDP-N-acetylglucosamine 2-epimerase (non-hydrolysing)